MRMKNCKVCSFTVKLMDRSGQPAASTGPRLAATSSWKLAHPRGVKKPATSGKKWTLFIGEKWVKCLTQTKLVNVN